MDEVGIAGGFDDIVPPVRAAAMTMSAGLYRARATPPEEGRGKMQRKKRERKGKHGGKWRKTVVCVWRLGPGGLEERRESQWLPAR